MSKFGWLLSRGQPCLPDVDHRVSTIFTQRSPGRRSLTSWAPKQRLNPLGHSNPNPKFGNNLNFKNSGSKICFLKYVAIKIAILAYV